MRHIISLKEQSKEDILKMLDMAIKLKEKRNKGEMKSYLPQKTMIMFFEKSSTRTRLSFEAGMTELGGHAIFLDKRTSQFSKTDFGHEIQAVMRYADILMYRAKKAENVEKAASFDAVPVIDACSEKYHPAQALSDILTMAEHADGIENVKKIVWLGIENNVSNTLKLACAKLGIEVVLAAPEVDPDSVDEDLDKQAEDTGNVKKILDLEEALEDADYVHTDTWINMEFFNDDGSVKDSFKDEYDRRIDTFKPYQLNAEIIDKYAPEAKIMHCMPCHLGYEISRDAVEHDNSVIFDQAENRMHMQKAMILWQLGIEKV
ncbi:ornithine carbamoyltransferase [Candidatus Dojkabacteria bacterium]|nr:ornithine carbamoyltransferase [Candidatus Dojkabacteria bacterium]